MHSDEFTITLPSDVNANEYPENRQSNYTVKLATPLTLHGDTLNEEVEWQACLTSMQYTNRFYDVKEPMKVLVAVRFDKQSDIDDQAPRTRAEEFAKPTEVDDFDDEDVAELSQDEKDLWLLKYSQSLLRYDSSAAEIPDGAWLAVGRIVIPAGVYGGGVDDVYKRLVLEFNKLFTGNRYNTVLAYEHVSDGTVRLKVTPQGRDICLYANTQSACKALGFHSDLLGSSAAGYIHEVDLAHPRIPRLDTMESMFVYTDIIKEQHVGNAMAPLLSIVPVTGTVGKRTIYVPEFDEWITLRKNYIDIVNVRITDSNGDDVQFPVKDDENVVVRLSIRRKPSLL